MILPTIKLKELASKLNLAVEKSKIRPQSGWIELESSDTGIHFKVSGTNYFLDAHIDIENMVSNEKIHATILAETFIPLVAKLDSDTINLYEKFNALIIETDKSSYNFPIIKELGKVKSLTDNVNWQSTENSISSTIDSNSLVSIASVNSKGLLDSMFTQEIQNYIYVDEKGAITFTENIYVNNFNTEMSSPMKFLLDITQAKLLEIFKDESQPVIIYSVNRALNNSNSDSSIVLYFTNSTNTISLYFKTATQDMTDRFPSIRLRALTENSSKTHVILDKKALDKALARLMVFDKKFDITVLDYSKLVFKENELELISIKNNNFEKIPYISSTNAFNHESIIRFADLVKQLKAINSKEVDISYGDRPAIILNSDIYQVIPEIITKERI